MKKEFEARMLATLIAATLCLGLLSGCGKNDAPASPQTASVPEEPQTQATDQGAAETIDATPAEEPAKAYKQTLQIALSAEPNTLDPHMGSAAATREITRGVFEGLFEIDANSQPRLELAQSYEANSDFTEYTFKLRQGVLFHNGQEMKAADAAASVNRWLDLAGMPDKSIAKGDHFEVVDDYTIKISLSKPCVLLPFILANHSQYAAILPESVILASGNGPITDLVGTGPLKFVEWAQTQYIHLSKFDSYVPYADEFSGFWGKKEVVFQDMYINIVYDPTIRTLGLETGEYDMSYDILYDDLERIRSNPDLKYQIESAATLNLIMNKKGGLFTNELYRQALARGVDREAVMRAAVPNEEFYHPSSSFFVDWQTDWFSEVPDTVSYDLEAAKALLAEAGYNGEVCRIISTQVLPSYYNAALVLQQQLEAIGFTTSLDVSDWATMLGKTDDPTSYDCYPMGYPIAASPASIMYLTSGVTSGFTDDPGLNAMFETLNAQPSIEAASKYWREEMAGYSFEKALAINLGDSPIVYAFSGKTESYSCYVGIDPASLRILE
ncbi:MAG: ABC transporter substrate-binding protein [Clostridiales bacterium]|jgi:peptide/nickel transport system substrate-binding protein|nr:ABC transporter substrate-binding protein [Clostridiales bacterium]